MNRTCKPLKHQMREILNRAYFQKKRNIFSWTNKYFVVLSLLFLAANGIRAQQMPNFSLYMMNPYLYNPAIAGTANYYQIRTNHRFQWVGLKDAPITNYISAFGPHSKKDMGYGGSISSDVIGKFSYTNISGTYAYNVKMTSDIRISMGLRVGVVQVKQDLSDANWTGEETNVISAEPNTDPAYQNTVYSKFLPDASVGVYVWSGQFFGGFSANQLLSSKLNLTSYEQSKGSKLTRHYYLIGGYTHVINREWSVEGTLILRKVVPAPFQLEIDGKVIYNKMLWGGLAFRTQDAVSILLGYTHEKKYHFAYSFDYSFTNIRKYAPMSHEIVIGVNFNQIKKKKGSKKR